MAANIREQGHLLVDQIRAKGEMVVVDLGCGFRKSGNIGIDITSEGTAADLVCRLGFEPIPLDDACVDKVVCRDFLEHIPRAIYDPARGHLIYPVIDLMNEIWRIIKPGGTFESFTPCYPHPEVFQDPTHVSVWTEKSMGYFCGEYPVARQYGVMCDFEMLEQRMEKFYLYARLKKPAQLVP